MPFAFLFALTLGAAATAPPDPCGPDGASRREQAQAAYSGGRYVDAARRYEALWRCGRQPRDIVNAVQSYYLAERLGEAIALWDSNLAAGVELGEALTRDGHKLIHAARSHTTEVQIELGVTGRAPPPTADISVCRIGGASEDCIHQPAIAVPRGGALVALRLDPGPWELRVRWADQTALERRTVRVSDATITERFTGSRPRPPHRLPAGLLGAASVLSAVGLGLSVFGWQYNAVETASNRNFKGSEGLPLRTAGATVGATGLGLAISGASIAWADQRRLRRFGIAGTVLGVALGGAGAALLAHGHARFVARAPAKSLDAASQQGFASEHLAGGLALGLGTGLLVGGVASLVAGRPAAASRTRFAGDFALSRGFAGLRFRVDF